jgi:hypothetical protein
MANFELYHDESMENGYWHGMLLVPTSQKGKLIEYLDNARNFNKYHAPIGIKRIKKKNRVYLTADAWIQIAVGFLRSNSKGKKYPLFLGKSQKGKKIYEHLPNSCVGVKFILFREVDAHRKMGFYTDHASKIETTFRMGLKGGLHFLGSPNLLIEIEKMHFDGHEHYARHLDKSRIVGRLLGLRSYCSIRESNEIIDDRSSDHRKLDSQSYEDCQLLQLTDLLVGGFRTLLGEKTRDIHLELSRPIKQIIVRQKEGYARMSNSRWFGSFCASQCYLGDGQWKFESIENLSYEKYKVAQMSLFD